MKFILMLLALFILTDPVLARPVLTQPSPAQPVTAHPVSNSSGCQNMYREYMNAYETGRSVSKKQMADFVNACMPGNVARTDEAYHRKLIQNADDIRSVNIARM